MIRLTARQRQVTEMIREFVEVHGFPPTRAEIAQAMGFRSVNAAEEHLKALSRKGIIDLQTGASRGIRLRQPKADLPVIGQVAAGSPIFAEQHIEQYWRIDAELFQPRADYLLRVRGMSMRDAGIWEDDLLAVHRTVEAHNGQVVVARLDDEVTVKRFSRKGHEVWLLPENPDFPPLRIDLRTQALVIEGLGVGVIRNGRPL